MKRNCALKINNIVKINKTKITEVKKMKEFALTYGTKDLSLVKTIIKNEDLDAVALTYEDALGNVWIGIVADEEDYKTIKGIYNMVTAFR